MRKGLWEHAMHSAVSKNKYLAVLLAQGGRRDDVSSRGASLLSNLFFVTPYLPPRSKDIGLKV